MNTLRKVNKLGPAGERDSEPRVRDARAAPPLAERVVRLPPVRQGALDRGALLPHHLQAPPRPPGGVQRGFNPTPPNPKSEARNPKHQTRNLKSQTRARNYNPKPLPETRNPEPEIRNPKPETRNPKSKTLNPKPKRNLKLQHYRTEI